MESPGRRYESLMVLDNFDSMSGKARNLKPQIVTKYCHMTVTHEICHAVPFLHFAPTQARLHRQRP